MRTYRKWYRYKCTAMLTDGRSVSVTVKATSKEKAMETAKKVIEEEESNSDYAGDTIITIVNVEEVERR